MTDASGGISQAIQTERRRLLMDATISAIYEHGLSRLTLAKIAAVAGLSAGSVNFHFSSKETLLLATLTWLAQELEQGIDLALAAAGDDPAQRLLALFEASLDPEVTEPRKTAVWFAFAAEARGRADYQRICGAQDKKTFGITLQLCDELIRAGDNAHFMDARAMANAIQGLIDEIWQEILYAGEEFDREDASHMYLSFLASVFPWAYQPPSAHASGDNRLTVADDTLRITRVDSQHLKDTSYLFDLYRQYYKQPTDAKLAHRFIGDNINQQRSVIFLAQDNSGRALGFVQLYPGWCSVAAGPIWTLFDLYVEQAGRRRGVGRALMNAAEAMARESGASRIELETEIDNYNGQALYEDLGYQRDVEFYKYSLALD